MLEDATVLFFNDFPDSKKRHQKILEMRADLKSLMRYYDNKLSLYLVKLTYEINKSLKVVPSELDLARTRTMKNIEGKLGRLGHTAAIQFYKKIKTRSLAEVNKEALREVLANDVSRAFGMLVQDQRLYKNPSTEVLHFLLKACWIDNATLLQPLAGDAKHDGNYLVMPVVVPRGSDVAYLSSYRIPDLPVYLALLLVLADRDAIGSIGQNKLTRDGHLIGIDFGHAYPRKNPLLDSLHFDFSFNVPSFKNYSIFSDALRSDLMKGVLILARLAKFPVDDAIVRSYGPEFYERWSAVIPHADEGVFDDYLKKLEMGLRASLKEYDDLINMVAKMKERHIASRDFVISKFSGFLTIPASLIDSLQNMEKLTMAFAGKTSLRSPDGSVMLRHLRMEENSVQQWICGPHGENTYRVTAEFKSAEDAEHALSCLRNFDYDTDKLPVFQRENSLTFFIPYDQLPALKQMVSEETIKRRFHSEDYELYQRLLHDEQIFESVSKLSQYGLLITYKGEELTFTADGSEISYEASQFVRAGLLCLGFKMSLDEKAVTRVELDSERFEVFQQFLLVFHHYYQNYRNDRNAFDELLSEINDEFQCDFRVNGVDLVYQVEQGFQFKLNLTGDSSLVRFMVSKDKLFDLDSGFKYLIGQLRYEAGAQRVRFREAEQRAQFEKTQRRLEEEAIRQKELEQKQREEALQRLKDEQLARQQEIERLQTEKMKALEAAQLCLDLEVEALEKLLERDASVWNTVSTLYNTSLFAGENTKLSVASVLGSFLGEWLRHPDRHQTHKLHELEERLRLRREHLNKKKSKDPAYQMETSQLEKLLCQLEEIIKTYHMSKEDLDPDSFVLLSL